LSSVSIAKIRADLRNYNYGLANALSSALILGSENVNEIIEKVPFPIIITDDKDKIKFSKGFIKRENLNDIKSKYKNKHQFVEITYQGFKIGRIYYGEPKSIFYLSILPLVLSIIVFLSFIIIIISIKSISNYESEKFYSLFAKGLAHQMGTPISSLIANYELLKMGEDVSNDIENDLKRITSILKRFSKIGSPSKFQEVSLKSIISESYENLKNKLNREFELKIKGDDLVWGDFELLTWVFENFIKNSYEALSPSVDISISSSRKKTIVDIIDFGKGIDKKISKNLFKKNLSTKKEGWGIGLILSKRILDLHKAKVKLIKTDEEYTHFRIEFPKFHIKSVI
jgi:signal transduction histidine kinase